MTSFLDDLSGVELKRRLTQRGIEEHTAEELIDHRDDCAHCRALIFQILGF